MTSWLWGDGIRRRCDVVVDGDVIRREARGSKKFSSQQARLCVRLFYQWKLSSGDSDIVTLILRHHMPSDDEPVASKSRCHLSAAKNLRGFNNVIVQWTLTPYMTSPFDQLYPPCFPPELLSTSQRFLDSVRPHQLVVKTVVAERESTIWLTQKPGLVLQKNLLALREIQISHYLHLP